MAENKQFENTDNLADVKKFLGKILRRWYWVALSLIIALTIAFLLNRYETPVYVIKASIITKKFEDRSSGMIPYMFDGDNFFRNRIEVFQEIPLLRSQDKIRETVNRLDYNVAYYVEGNIKTSEMYKNSHYSVFIDSASTNIPYQLPIYIRILDVSNYTLSLPNSSWTNVLDDQVFRFNQDYDLNGFKFRIQLNSSNGGKEVKNYFIINHPEHLVGFFRSKLNISWAQRGSAILDISMQSILPEKDLDFIKNYFDVVIEKGLEEKNAYATNTINFINHQLDQIADSLVRFKFNIDDYKLENRELANGSSYVYNKLAELDQEKARLILANNYYDYLEKYVRQQRNAEVFAPNIIGLEAPLLDQLITEYMQVKMEDKIDKNEANAKNPLVNRSYESIERLEKNIYESIENLKLGNREALQEINDKINFYYSSVKEFQNESRELSQFERMYQLNENLYNMLLEKKTEASIAKASTTSDYQIVEQPSFSPSPIYPDKKKNYIIALVLGLGLPIGFIYLQDLLNNKIITKDDLNKHSTLPYIGNIGHSSIHSNLVVKERPKSLISESFRSIRANLKYFISTDGKEKNVYLITSSIGGEGKTFCSINLAFTFASTGKKTLLMGADMRKPTLADYLETPDGKGLSNYLAGFVEKEDILISAGVPHLDIILGGDVPPNPAELLASEKMANLIAESRNEYEYIIIDTPPIGLVSDAMELLKYTDINFLIVRQGKTYKSALDSINEMYMDGKIKDFAVIFNDINFKKLSYGSGYGYGYGYGSGYGYGYGKTYGYGYYEEDKEPKSWWNLFTKKDKKRKKKRT
ncbi:MAG: polysaccharide biosynthesis tyrosine autokinase [Candidatus Cyclobacteriaceae bacterium M3_2C_046]